jgi:two-component system chemotaxis sensor kinase CheA
VSDNFDEIEGIFFEECAEGLAVAEQGLSAMAAGDVSREVIAGVFRAVHSIKGGSGAFGHSALLAFSHCFENVLDEVRSGKILPTADVTKVMLAALDILADHVEAAQTQSPTPVDAAALAALERVLESKGAIAQDAVPASPELAPLKPATDAFGFTPVVAAVEDFDPFGFESVEVALGELVPDDSSWRVRFAPSRAALANGAEPLLSIREIERLGGSIVSVDVSALPTLCELDPQDSYFVWTLSVPGTVEEGVIAECFDFVASDSVIEITRHSASARPPAPVTKIAEVIPAETPHLTLVEKTAPAQHPANAPEARPTEQVHQTIRVDLSKLDMLLNLVGELVIRGSILSDRLLPADQERVELPELARLTHEIQDNVMSLRAQPIRQAFSRVPRMLRDLGAETGKQVILEIIGETTEVDKGVIEKIGDPLTHMIRNAIDHGIEEPAERLAAGKPAEGRITLSAEQKGARIFVRVSDDGKGIDRERVRAKAIERGIIAADAVLSVEEIDQLICAPGFSTAEAISNISGRGVGMDVVRSSVEALGGRVDITSTPGVGTSFTMILPLTLAILDGMIVRLAGQRFVLPLANVIETVRPDQGQVHAMTPTSEVIELRGVYLPVKRLSDLFGLGGDEPADPQASLVIIVETETAGNVGLMVDTIDDCREVVIKSLEQNLHPIRGLGGATILGDGSIALILDIEALVASTGQLGLRYQPKGLAA